jgi:hypothetical protein
MSIKAHPERILDTLGIDNYRIDGTKIHILLHDWCKIARYFDKKTLPGCECFYAVGYWWRRVSKEGLRRWEDTPAGYDP